MYPQKRKLLFSLLKEINTLFSHHFHILPFIHIYLEDHDHHAVWYKTIHKSVTFPFSANGRYRTNQARVKEWNSFPKVFKRSTLLEIPSWLLWDLQLPDSAPCWCDCSFVKMLHHWGEGASDIPSSSDFTGTWLGRYCKGVPFIQQVLCTWDAKPVFGQQFQKAQMKAAAIKPQNNFKLLVQSSLSQFLSSKACLNSQVFLLHHQENF